MDRTFLLRRLLPRLRKDFEAGVLSLASKIREGNSFSTGYIVLESILSGSKKLVLINLIFENHLHLVQGVFNSLWKAIQPMLIIFKSLERPSYSHQESAPQSLINNAFFQNLLDHSYIFFSGNEGFEEFEN
ncbi:hypothetical protein HPP92_020110 [Vanilla planifolia]|uniref:Uncharacterized protein n=1 Tax=Vanilla planifolia TaxID=51239 RepID=A0A835Q856_VANPL|nr:hypothetical protein HPP92_020110 [Vanilla planifolia]